MGAKVMTAILKLILEAIISALQPSKAPPVKSGGSPSLDLIKLFEGLRLEAYLCPADVWTIGYGHTKGVNQGDKITQAGADAFLAQDVLWVAAAVDKKVTAPINANQRAALYSFIYNVGAGAFGKSTMLRKLNNWDYDGAANEFKRWNKGGGKVLNGLIRRRTLEAALFRKAP